MKNNVIDLSSYVLRTSQKVVAYQRFLLGENNDIPPELRGLQKFKRTKIKTPWQRGETACLDFAAALNVF